MVNLKLSPSGGWLSRKDCRQGGKGWCSSLQRIHNLHISSSKSFSYCWTCTIFSIFAVWSYIHNLCKAKLICWSLIVTVHILYIFISKCQTVPFYSPKLIGLLWTSIARYLFLVITHLISFLYVCVCPTYPMLDLNQSHSKHVLCQRWIWELFCLSRATEECRLGLNLNDIITTALT